MSITKEERKQMPFDAFKDCYSCIEFNYDSRDGTFRGYKKDYCNKHGAIVPDDFQEKGCDDWDNIPF